MQMAKNDGKRRSEDVAAEIQLRLPASPGDRHVARVRSFRSGLTEVRIGVRLPVTGQAGGSAPQSDPEGP